MDKQSLIKAQQLIIKVLQKSNINELDKLGLILDITKYLDNYDENNQVLNEHLLSKKRKENKRII